MLDVRMGLRAGALTMAVATLGLVVTPAASAQDAGAAAPDRYDLANGCWALESTAANAFVTREGDGFTATASDLDAAEPFHLEPTELGVYLLFGSTEDFVAADGSGVASADSPSPAAEWVVDDAEAGGFTITTFDGDERLTADASGALVLAAAAGDDQRFTVSAHTGCAVWPDPQINISGEHPTGDTAIAEASGYVDAHLHQMAFEFLGGSAHCGRPWHRYGVTHALVDCVDHQVADGSLAVLENFLQHGTPNGNHDPVGWPTFVDWPAHKSLTHEQTYYSWMERNWRGGLRLYTNLLVENGALCDLYPIKRNSCDEMESVRLQLQDMLDMRDYIDAQSGGPGEGWFQIVTDPFQAREVINAGKLAVILGIETSVLFGCGLQAGQPTCTTDDIDEQLAEFYDAGVRQMELVNKFDSALSGVAGDSGSFGLLVNTGNFWETGRFWDMRTCTNEDAEHVHDREQESLGEFPEQDAIFGAISELYGPGAPTPIYPEGPHCNALGLGLLGSYVIDEMIERGMIIDPDHMSVLGRQQALDQIESRGYEGVISSHSWSTPDAYARIMEMGGFIAAIPGGNAESFIQDWRNAREWADPRYTFGFGYGADANGFATQPARLDQYLDTPVTYPFTGFGGVTVDQQVSGERVYDVNVDGVAHYGLYPDWIEGLRLLAGEQIIEDFERGPEAYLQMWERAVGITGDACRDDIDDLTRGDVDALAPGTDWVAVLEALGQPNSREASTFTYCVGDDMATLEFDVDNAFVSASYDGVAPAPTPAPEPSEPHDHAAEEPLPATGGGAATTALAILGLAGLGLGREQRRRASLN